LASYLPLIHCPGADPFGLGEHSGARQGRRPSLVLLADIFMPRLAKPLFQFGQDFRDRVCSFQAQCFGHGFRAVRSSLGGTETPDKDDDVRTAAWPVFAAAVEIRRCYLLPPTLPCKRTSTTQFVSVCRVRYSELVSLPVGA